LIAQAQKSISKASSSTGKRLSAKQSIINADIAPNEVQFEQNVDLLKRNLRGGAEDDGMSMSDLRRLVADLQARLEERDNSPKIVRSSNTKRSFTPVDTNNKVNNPLKNAASTQ
jgi:hypothetical protein